MRNDDGDFRRRTGNFVQDFSSERWVGQYPQADCASQSAASALLSVADAANMQQEGTFGGVAHIVSGSAPSSAGSLRLSLRPVILKSAKSFVDIWQDIAALRQNSLVEDDVATDPLHFLATTSHQRRSCCSVACWDGKKLAGLVLATQHLVRGIPTGYAIGGDYSGRGLIVCRPEHENAVIEAAVKCMFANGIHSLQLRMAPRAIERPDFSHVRVKRLDTVIPGDRMNLAPTYEAFLSTLGRHTRRNVRYYTRRAADAGIRFEPWLANEEFIRERERLNGITPYPVKRSHLEEIDRVLALHGDGQRMGLRAADGQVVALLCGFTRGRRFHVLTQWNDPTLAKASLSVVLRGYTAEHLIERGFNELHFVGGLSLSLGRFCPPHRYCSISLDRKSGAMNVVKKLVASYCLRRTRAGKHVSSVLKTLSSGFLDSSLLARDNPPSFVVPTLDRDGEME